MGATIDEKAPARPDGAQGNGPQPARGRAGAGIGTSGGGAGGDGSEAAVVEDRIAGATWLMLEYLTGQGLQHPASKPSFSLEGWISYYNELAERIKPATPAILAALQAKREAREAQGAPSRAVEARGITWFVATAAMISLAVTVWSMVVLGGEISSAAITLGKPYHRVLKVLFDLGVAGLGASLALFSQIQTYVTRNIYWRHYNITYVVKFLSGIIAGFVLAELLSAALGGGQNGTANAGDFGVGALALVGGAVAPAVYNIIKRLAEAAETITESRAEEREKAAREKAELSTALAEERAKT